MLTGLADRHFIDLERSIMVGDSASDRQAAEHAGIAEFILADAFFGR
jgi:histidinol phosphatase-like enzyme